MRRVGTGPQSTLRQLISEVLISELQSSTAATAACRYEATVIKAIRAAGASGKIKRANCVDATANDADVSVGGQIHTVEVKSSPRAQMGGGSLGYSKGEFTAVGSDPFIAGTAIDLLDSSSDRHELTRSLDDLLAFLSKKSHREISGFPASGFTLDAWSLAVERGLVQVVNRYVESDVSVIAKHYASKGVHYVQIADAGLFRLSSKNPAGFPVPKLSGRVVLEIRAAKAGDSADAERSKAGLRVQARLSIDVTSPYTLDDPESIREMLRATEI